MKAPRAAWIPGVPNTLREFLRANREDLISRCRLKVSQRSSRPATAIELQYGVPLILEQLSDALVHEEASPTPHADCVFGYPLDTAGAAEARRTAALHGAELFRLGYSVEEVVHDYGDLCQAITELAQEVGAPVTIDEFHTFNRLLDSSIASAVSAYACLEHSLSEAVHDRIGALAEEQRTLISVALKALDVLKTGNVGVMGATGAVLEDSLLKLRDRIDRSLPEIRAAAGVVTPPALADARRSGEHAAEGAGVSLDLFVTGADQPK